MLSRHAQRESSGGYVNYPFSIIENCTMSEPNMVTLIPAAAGTFLDNLYNLYTRKSLTNVKIVVDDQVYTIHRAVLAVGGEEIERKLILSGSGPISIWLFDVLPQAVKIAINLLYGQRQEISSEIYDDVLKVCKMLKVDFAMKTLRKRRYSTEATSSDGGQDP